MGSILGGHVRSGTAPDRELERKGSGGGGGGLVVATNFFGDGNGGGRGKDDCAER